MDKQKQINEMHQILLSAGYDWWKTAPNGKTKSEYEAECFYNAGYRKIPENAVVLTEERNKIICDRFAQLERVQAELQELNTKYYNEAKDLRRELKRVRKETAEKFAERVHNLFNRDIKDSVVYTKEEKNILKEFIESIDEICKEITEGD